MIPVLDIDNQAEQLLPPTKRGTKWLVTYRSFLAPVKRRYKYFRWFMDGADTDFYSSTYTYAKGDNTKDIFGVYESLTDGNLGNPTTDPANWLKVLDCFIGMTEQAQYNGRKLVYEYALNRFLNGLPQGSVRSEFIAANSDIYITTDVPAYTSFVMYPDSVSSSKMFPTLSTGFMFSTPVYITASTYKFTIYVPSALYASLGLSAEQIIRLFADRYCVIGCYYSIQTY